MDLAAIKRILGTTDGAAFKDFIRQHIRALDTLDGITATDPQEIAVQVEGRRSARKVLIALFGDLITLSTPGPEKETENEYAINV